MARAVVDLDVREMLRAKEEPFQRIMETVSGLGPEDVFQLHATFRPDPLIRVLGKQGFAHAVVQAGDDHFIVQFYHPDGAEGEGGAAKPRFHLDNRGLEPPQPMLRTLGFLEEHPACQTGELELEIWNDRVPAFLLPELTDRGYAYEILEENPDGARVRIYRAS
ncbi:MAG: DUF2249 domain-containing protein [Alicyclobacillus sp.]|nr:DUF2249 domain-containing protein [Alicyclobacillus sp.]